MIRRHWILRDIAEAGRFHRRGARNCASQKGHDGEGGSVSIFNTDSV